MLVDFDTSSMEDYKKFLRLKSVPSYHWRGTTAVVADEYASALGETKEQAEAFHWEPASHCFDYQRDITLLAIKKKKFAIFAECGTGKTICLLEFAQAAKAALSGKGVLIVSPLMVVTQTLAEANKFYPDIEITQVAAAGLQKWMDSGSGIGITNYEAIKEGLRIGNVGALICDESSFFKSAYGAWGTRLIELGRGLEWKLALTGTPAPNDRIEYANHAVFCDHFRTVNEFLARYFVNRGETQNRWEIKPHALRPFYHDLSHWCIFLSNPAVYGWKDNCENIPPIHIHVDRIDLTEEQVKEIRKMKPGTFSNSLMGGVILENAGGIKTRGKIAQLAKGRVGDKDIHTNKPQFIRDMVDSWPDESTLIWCRYNAEQDTMEKAFPEAGSIRGETSYEERMKIIEDFKSRKIRVLISKPKVLGFGLNLQVATRQVFSGLQDSWEEFHQAVKRSNRIGSTRPLNVHIPITDIEAPMIQTVLEKAKRIEHDTREQERLFKELRMK